MKAIILVLTVIIRTLFFRYWNFNLVFYLTIAAIVNWDLQWLGCLGLGWLFALAYNEYNRVSLSILKTQGALKNIESLLEKGKLTEISMNELETLIDKKAFSYHQALYKQQKFFSKRAYQKLNFEVPDQNFRVFYFEPNEGNPIPSGAVSYANGYGYSLIILNDKLTDNPIKKFVFLHELAHTSPAGFQIGVRRLNRKVRFWLTLIGVIGGSLTFGFGAWGIAVTYLVLLALIFSAYKSDVDNVWIAEEVFSDRWALHHLQKEEQGKVLTYLNRIWRLYDRKLVDNEFYKDMNNEEYQKFHAFRLRLSKVKGLLLRFKSHNTGVEHPLMDLFDVPNTLLNGFLVYAAFHTTDPQYLIWLLCGLVFVMLWIMRRTHKYVDFYKNDFKVHNLIQKHQNQP